MFKAGLIVVLFSIGVGAPSSARAAEQPVSSSSSAAAQEPWQKEFDDVCSRTDDAMTFSEAELSSLISRCGALQPQIEKLDETRKKVYLERLRVCRGLYAYVLESKRKSDKK